VQLIEQLLSLVQAKPLSNNKIITYRSTRMIKPRMTFCKYHKFWKLMFLLSYRS